MRLIHNLNEKYTSVSIIGLAKNAGKTVTMNYLIEEAYEADILLGLTSTGRDGERTDLVTDTDKPEIFVSEGTIIATAKSTLEMGDAGLEILESTEFTSPMGNIIICRVKEEGCVQIAGPVNSRDMMKVKDRMLDYGAQLVLIDGAIDRKAVSSPLITDSCIVSTGAVISRDIKKVVLETAYFVEIYSLPKVEDERLEELRESLDRTCIIDRDYKIVYPEIKTGLGRGKTLTTYVDDDTRYIYIAGAATSSMLRDLTNGNRNYEIIIEDGTKVFSDRFSWNELRRKGLRVKVLNSINIEAVTVNPLSPYGYSFDSSELTERISGCLKEIKVFDVLAL
ncbi:hypothetical protein SAMN02745751_01132 [Dethiosulfatibacter aminovorans DSM 17477]|uniref:Uncharacterized protein n=1 Tax=Dethiosulfatibacter aminovorans DSM 17477 TaxID=1121476 RepID=A0A1M6EB73_9FIRM|nr:hypothetical protein [Dethiosulfatibacter aminovorans]SHI82538.1 hypothetical protein SAMN02745751_01132 [Dethiosulfatibacter aminovorans DSM 17477]